MLLLHTLKALLRHYIPPSAFAFADELRFKQSAGSSQTAAEYFDYWYQPLQTHSIGLSDLHVMEIGSGRYAQFALHLLAAGARHVTLVDLYAVSLDDAKHRMLLGDECAHLGLDIEAVRQRITVLQGDVLIVGPDDLCDPPDLIASKSVLEHVVNPADVLKHCFTLLRPGGLTSHIVDVGAHGAYPNPFTWLQHSKDTWERWFQLRGGYHLNRWRPSDYVRAAEEAGLAMMSYEVITENRPALDAVLGIVADDFRAYPQSELAVLTFHLLARKP